MAKPPKSQDRSQRQQMIIKKANLLNMSKLYGEHENTIYPLLCTYDAYRMWLIAVALYQQTGSLEFAISFNDYAEMIGIIKPRPENIRNSLHGIQRVIACILVLVLLIATYPRAVFALDGITLTIDSPHCAVTNAETGEKLPNPMYFEEPTEVSFCITPDKGYTLQAVTTNGEALEPNEYDIYTLMVDTEMTLTVSALDTLVPVIELSSVEPEGWAQEKYITVNVSDNSGEVAVYCSKNAYTMAAELNTALANGEASLVTEGKSTVRSWTPSRSPAWKTALHIRAWSFRPSRWKIFTWIRSRCV